MSTVEAWSFAAPLKFLIRKLRCFFRKEKKKGKREVCSLPRYFVPPFSKPSARSFVKRWSLAGLTSSSQPRSTFYHAAVSFLSSREKLRFIRPLKLCRIFSERYCKNRRNLSRFAPSQAATLRHLDRLTFFARYARFQVLLKRKHLTNRRNKFHEIFLVRAQS